MTDGQERVAATKPRWDVLVLPDVIDAEDETRARAIFVQALIDEPGLIRVQRHIEEEGAPDVNFI